MKNPGSKRDRFLNLGVTITKDRATHVWGLRNVTLERGGILRRKRSLEKGCENVAEQRGEIPHSTGRREVKGKGENRHKFELTILKYHYRT